MALTVNDVCCVLNDCAPEGLAAEWDNVGLLVGDPGAPVTQVLVTLEVTPEVLEEAQRQGCEMIVAHHPVIFQPLCTVRPDRPPGGLLYQAIRDGFHLYAAHSNLDLVPGGTSDVLAEILGLQHIQVLQPVVGREDFPAPIGWGRIGTLAEPQPLGDLAQEVQARLNSACCRLLGPPAQQVQTVAVCGGSGAHLVPAAQSAGAQVLITGDVKYHPALDAKARGLALIDAGHYATERPVVARLAQRLQKALPDLAVRETQAGREPFAINFTGRVISDNVSGSSVQHFG